MKITMNKAYKNTPVNWSRTQTHITKLLNNRGIFEHQFTNLQDRFILQFRVVENGISKPIAVRIVVPFQTEAQSREREKEMNSLHRVLFYHLKAKFIAIESGLTEFMEEFMAHLIVTDKSGKSSTMGAMMLPQYKESLESGKQNEFKLLGDGQ